MQYTGNLNLKKPDGTDVVDIADLNNNADIIDSEIGKIKSGTTKVKSAETADNAINLGGQPSSYYTKKTETDNLAGIGRTTETVKGNADKISTHEVSTTAHPASSISVADAGGLLTATHVEGALSELFTSASNGKNAIASAITGKGGTASGSDTFAQLANEINNVASWDAELIPGNILEGKNIFGVDGSIPNMVTHDPDGIGSVGYSKPIQMVLDNPMWLYWKPRTGYYEAGNWLMQEWSKLGVARAVPGDTVILSSDAQFTTLVTSYVKAKEIKMSVYGTVRVKFDLVATSNHTRQTYGRIYVNGVPVGIERILYSSTGARQTYSEDISIKANDLIQLYIRSNNGSTANCDSFRICVPDTLLGQVIL